MAHYRARGNANYKVGLDTIAITLMLIAAALFIFTGIEPGTQAIGTFLAAFFAVGLGMMFAVNHGLLYDAALRGEQQTSQFLKYFLLCMVAILAATAFVNIFPTALFVVFGLTTVSVASGAVVLLIAVPEELFFRGALTPWFANSALGKWGGSLLAGFVFALYHYFVYGDNFNALFIVAFAGFVFSITVLSTRRISITMAAHMTNNFLSLGLPLSTAGQVLGVSFRLDGIVPQLIESGILHVIHG